jgi:hypothetical protein
VEKALPLSGIIPLKTIAPNRRNRLMRMAKIYRKK